MDMIEKSDVRKIVKFVRDYSYPYAQQISLDDMSQEILLRLFQRSLPKRLNPGWLAKYVRCRAVDLLREQQRKQVIQFESFAEADDTGIEFASGRVHVHRLPPPGADREPAEPDLIHALYVALSSLSPPHAEAIALVSEGLSYKEIADRTAVPVGTVRSRICYARRRLASDLTDFR